MPVKIVQLETEDAINTSRSSVRGGQTAREGGGREGRERDRDHAINLNKVFLTRKTKEKTNDGKSIVSFSSASSSRVDGHSLQTMKTFLSEKAFSRD